MNVARSQSVRFQNQSIHQPNNRGIPLGRLISGRSSILFQIQIASIHVGHERGQRLIRFSKKTHDGVIQLGQRNHHRFQIRFQQISQCIQRFEIQRIRNRDS